MRYLPVLLLLLPLAVQAQTFDEIEAALDSLAQIEIHGPDSLGTAWIEYEYANGVRAELFFLQGESAYAWMIMTADSARIMTPTHGVISMAPVTLSLLQNLSNKYEPGSIMAALLQVQAIGAAKARTRPIIE